MLAPYWVLLLARVAKTGTEQQQDYREVVGALLY